MQLRGAVLLVGLLTGVALPLAVPASVADPVAPRSVESVTADHPATSPVSPAYRASRAVAARIAPPVVTVGEPALLVMDVSRAKADRPLEVQRLVDGSWTTLAETATDGRGHAEIPLDTTVEGASTLRVVAAPQGSQSRQVSSRNTLDVIANTQCSPATALVDPEATGEAICLATRLDRWRSAGLMGIGQQLNVSSQNALEPITELDGQPVAVVGFDLEELAMTGKYQFPFLEETLDSLLTLADQGAVLTASWHAKNPFTGGDFTDRSRDDLSELLNYSTRAAQRFWSDYDEKLDLLARFQDGDGGTHRRTAVVFRPLHEANGDFFWWGKPKPKVYRKVWQQMQDRAAAAGVHNIVWAYSFNRWTSGVKNPAKLVPKQVDVGGLDSYDPEKGKANAKDHLWLEGYSRVRPAVRRMALTEVGPHGSKDGSWNPRVITRTVTKKGLSPAWAMLWFDDDTTKQDRMDEASGKKQIGSLTRGTAWLRSCPNGLCPIR